MVAASQSPTAWAGLSAPGQARAPPGAAGGAREKAEPYRAHAGAAATSRHNVATEVRMVVFLIAARARPHRHIRTKCPREPRWVWVWYLARKIFVSLAIFLERHV